MTKGLVRIIILMAVYLLCHHFSQSDAQLQLMTTQSLTFHALQRFFSSDLDWPFLLQLSIHLCHNFVPKGSSLPTSPASVNCWGSGSVTEVTAAGLNIHLVPSTDTKTSPSLSTANTFPVRPRIYEWIKIGYYPV